MYQPNRLSKSASTTAISNVQPQALRAGSEDRFPYSFKSLFTLADVAVKRRARGSVKNLNIKTDENKVGSMAAVSMGSAFKRSKSSGDVAILGEKSRALNAIEGIGDQEKRELAGRSVKALRTRAPTTCSAQPSRIPKNRSAERLRSATDSPASSDSVASSISETSAVHQENDALKVDDALFVMLTPPQTPIEKTPKNLTLAAHVPSLPRVASPLSPRTNKSWYPRHLRPRNPALSSPGTGHTNASLHLTKSHWELRYEAWTLSLHTARRPRSARSIVRPTEDETPPRSRFPEPLTNPALFPRAGSLTPTALRPLIDGSVVEEDSRPALELDWAMRGWPLDRIQRALFVHDMDVRAWFPVNDALSEKDDAHVIEPMESEVKLMKSSTSFQAEYDEGEKEKELRRWEWDWELRWRVIEGMAEDSHRRKSEADYDVFLAEGDGERAKDQVYGGCEVDDDEEKNWEWSEDAMEVDSVL